MSEEACSTAGIVSRSSCNNGRIEGSESQFISSGFVDGSIFDVNPPVRQQILLITENLYQHRGDFPVIERIVKNYALFQSEHVLLVVLTLPLEPEVC